MPPKYNRVYKKRATSASAASSSASPPSSVLFKCSHTLVIVESPSKCKKIAEFLGDAYKVVATRGHIYEIDGLKSIDKRTFEPKYTILGHQRDTVKKLCEDVAIAARVMLATDDDREGEAIAYHVALVCGLPVETTARIVFHEITRPAILHAVENPRLINLALVQAQRSRAVLDVIVGFKLSPLLWKYIPRRGDEGKKKTGISADDAAESLSAGRCQTVALRLIYDNYCERKAAAEDSQRPSQMTYRVQGFFYAKNLPFELNRTFSDETDIRAFFEESRTYNHMYLYEKSAANVRTSTSKSPVPLNTSALIQKCSNTLHISPQQTMQLCQKLYQEGYITYMRTDSRKYAAPFLEEAKKYISAKYSTEALKPADEYDAISSGASPPPAGAGAGAVTAAAESHEAIRPTHIDWAVLPDTMNAREKSVYNLIRIHTIESCMCDAVYHARTNYISSPRTDLFYEFVTMKPITLGWKKVADSAEHIAIQNAQYMFFENMVAAAAAAAAVKYNHIQTIASIKSHQAAHYTEAGLVKKLEEMGIGRPSTFSFLVDVIQKRGYVKIADVEGIKVTCSEFSLSASDGVLKENTVEKEFAKESKKLVIQPIGIAALEFLLRYFDGFLNYEYTAKMEEQLDKIASAASIAEGVGMTAARDLCSECFQTLEAIIKPIKSEIDKEYPVDPHHSVIFTYKGPTIKYTPNLEAPDEGIVFKNIKPGIKLDIVKLDHGEYNLDDLLEIQNDCLGLYEGEPVYIRHGRYGVYITWGEKNVSIKHINKAIDQITLSDIEGVINSTAPPESAASIAEGVGMAAVAAPEITKNVLRLVTPHISVRKGKYGNYFYYKTPEMKNPEFVRMSKELRNVFMTCDPKLIEDYVIEKTKTKSS